MYFYLSKYFETKKICLVICFWKCFLKYNFFQFFPISSGSKQTTFTTLTLKMEAKFVFFSLFTPKTKGAHAFRRPSFFYFFDSTASKYKHSVQHIVENHVGGPQKSIFQHFHCILWGNSTSTFSFGHGQEVEMISDSIYTSNV